MPCYLALSNCFPNAFVRPDFKECFSSSYPFFHFLTNSFPWEVEHVYMKAADQQLRKQTEKAVAKKLAKSSEHFPLKMGKKWYGVYKLWSAEMKTKHYLFLVQSHKM